MITIENFKRIKGMSDADLAREARNGAFPGQSEDEKQAHMAACRREMGRRSR